MPHHILDLADELLNEILAFLVQSGRTPPNGSCGNGSNGIDMRRNGLADTSDLDHWRLVCKRFMRIGTPRRFERFALRCSEEGFRRLGHLIEMQLACYVKSFTYLVRPHYQGSGWKAILETLSLHDPSLSRLHTLRLCEQHTLLETHQDFQQLHLALTNLPSLQEIKLLRLQDEADEQLISSIDHRALNTQNLQLSWNSACARAITNLSTALLHSQHKSIRFTGPQLSPEASLQLLQVPLKSIASVASRLRGLDVTFTSDRDVTTLIARLSNAFNHFLHAAANLTSIHIGFPPLLPLNLELDAIFHGITLKNVHKLSLQGWRLASHEITALACRHRYTLRELRLCAVYLRPGGRWGDVLSELREEMGSLERVRLQDIDYERHFEDRGVADGVEVMDVPSAEAGPSSHPDTSQARVQGVDRVPAVVEPEWFESRDMLVEVAGLTADDLGDDGIQVRQEQIPLWETWVLARRNGMSNGHLC